MNFKNPWFTLAIGVLAGYSLSRVLDNVPLVNKIPKIRVN